MPRKANAIRAPKAIGEKAPIGLPDPLAAAQEAMRHAQEGNVKLARAVDCLRMGLQQIEEALDSSTEVLRDLARETLNKYAVLSGQPSRKRVVHTRAGEGHGDPSVLARGVNYAGSE